jgi:hypothetical protein
MRPLAARLVAFAAVAAVTFAGALLGGGGAVLPGCTPIQPAVRPTSSLPRYAGDIVDLFDDVIDPHAVGLELEGRTDPRSDPKVRNRSQMADLVARARVTTVTGELDGLEKAYQVGFKSVDHLAGKGTDIGDDFVVRVDKNTPAVGIVKNFEGRLVGKVFVVSVKAFSRMDGERELHFHADIDAPDVVAAVREAVVLEEVK